MNKSIFNILSILLVLILLFVSIIAVNAEENFENTHINTGNQAEDIISVAKTQIGFREGDNNDTKYGTWYGLPNQPWCAMFVSWCARQADVPLDILANCAIAAPDPGYFNIRYFDGIYYTPEHGDLFFSKEFTHVGLVDYADGDVFYTVEGNSNDRETEDNIGIGVFCRERKTAEYYFGVPDYNYRSQNHTCNKAVFVSSSDEHPHFADYICSYCGEIYTDESMWGFEADCSLCITSEVMLLGDANSDKIVNVKDATCIQKHLVGFAGISADDIYVCDTDLDGEITIKDSTCIRKCIAGISINTPVGLPIS